MTIQSLTPKGKAILELSEGLIATFFASDLNSTLTGVDHVKDFGQHFGPPLVGLMSMNTVLPLLPLAMPVMRVCRLERRINACETFTSLSG